MTLFRQFQGEVVRRTNLPRTRVNTGKKKAAPVVTGETAQPRELDAVADAFGARAASGARRCWRP